MERLIRSVCCAAVSAVLAVIGCTIDFPNSARSGDQRTLSLLAGIVSAEKKFFVEHGRYASAEELRRADPAVFDSKSRQAHQLNIVASGESFEVTAIPLTVNETGYRSFFVDSTNVVRYETGGKRPTRDSPRVHSR